VIKCSRTCFRIQAACRSKYGLPSGWTAIPGENALTPAVPASVMSDIETWSWPSRLSSIAYPYSASGPYPGGCSTCQASLVAGDWGGPSISLLP
jgi:hypothetical protein